MAALALCANNGRFLAALRYGRAGMPHHGHRQAHGLTAHRKTWYSKMAFSTSLTYPSATFLLRFG
jgi:hypothetical protein